MYLADENNNNVMERSKSLRHSKRPFKHVESHYFNNSEDHTTTYSKTIKINSDHLNISTGDTPRLKDSFFQQPCLTLARNLLGKVLVRKFPSGPLLKGIIVETESYLGVIDKASHSFNGKKTERNEAMYLKPGTAYVYSIYGMYYCFNISSLEDGSAVLIRALQPLEGHHVMKENRSKGKKATEIKPKDLCSGPSKLCQAMKIDKNFNKVDISSSNELWLENGDDIDCTHVISCKRIGIDSYGDEWANKPFRFYIRNNSFVSQRNKTAETSPPELLEVVR